jgi:aspartyl-tRNA(Asn)/glutamyl-tRNA(Gln) amidotransferase subunit B
MAVPAPTKTKYQPTIGIECHVQLKTKTKLFAAVGNDARDAPPNSLISHICVGLPGALPVLNRQAIELCVRAAVALNTKPQNFSKFERKHYFYPDLPKGYQITQYEDPIISSGQVEILLDGQTKTIRIERANLEEDAGKNTHPPGTDYSLVDLNRAGTPVLEIVSQPDIHSPAEAKAFTRELYLLMKYAGVTDGDLYHGHMRFDINTSVSTNDKLGTRSEVKNLNSFRSVEAAVAYEIKRQIEVFERGENITQETRGWDDAKQKTFSQRSKEEAEDYRYMPEPDVPPIELTDEWSTRAKSEMGLLPAAIRDKLNSLKLDRLVIEDILDNWDVYHKLAATLKLNTSAEIVRRVAFDSLEEPETLKVEVAEHVKVADMLISQDISSNSAKQILLYKAKNPDKSIDELAETRKQISDESAITKIVENVVAENHKVCEDIKAGEEKAISYLVGQVMAKSKGRANPQLAQELIRKQLNL